MQRTSLVLTLALLGAAASVRANAAIHATVRLPSTLDNPGGDTAGETFASATWSDTLTPSESRASAFSLRGTSSFALGVSAQSDPIVSSAEAWWSDTVTIAGAAEAPAMLIFRMEFQGILYVTLPRIPDLFLEGYVADANAFLSMEPGAASQNALAALRLSLSYDGVTVTRQEDSTLQIVRDNQLVSLTGGGVFSDTAGLFGVDSLVDFHIPITGNTGAYTAYLRAVANAQQGETADSLFSNTATLTQILLPDGTTPESQGMTLTFASGMISPNVAAVPEPGQFMIWTGLSALGLGVVGRRKLRAAMISRP